MAKFNKRLGFATLVAVFLFVVCSMVVVACSSDDNGSSSELTLVDDNPKPIGTKLKVGDIRATVQSVEVAGETLLVTVRTENTTNETEPSLGLGILCNNVQVGGFTENDPRMTYRSSSPMPPKSAKEGVIVLGNSPVCQRPVLEGFQYAERLGGQTARWATTP